MYIVYSLLYRMNRDIDHVCLSPQHPENLLLKRQTNFRLDRPLSWIGVGVQHHHRRWGKVERGGEAGLQVQPALLHVRLG